MSLIATCHQHCRVEIRSGCRRGMYLYSVSGRLTWLWPSPAQFDLSELSLSQGLSKDVVAKSDLSMAMCASP